MNVLFGSGTGWLFRRFVGLGGPCASLSLALFLVLVRWILIEISGWILTGTWVRDLSGFIKLCSWLFGLFCPSRAARILWMNEVLNRECFFWPSFTVFMAYLMPLCLLKQGRLLRAARHFVANLMFFLLVAWQLLPTADATGAACVNVGRAVAKR